jgi:hypothetical protein
MPIHKIRLPPSYHPPDPTSTGSSSHPSHSSPSSYPPHHSSSLPTSSSDPYLPPKAPTGAPTGNYSGRRRKYQAAELPPPGERNPPPDEFTCEMIEEVCDGDTRLAELWKHLLSEYIYFPDDDDGEDVKYNSYIRYVDLRERPYTLSRGGFLIRTNPDYLLLKLGTRIWKVSRRFNMVFRKKTMDDLLLEAAESVIQSIDKKYSS